MQRKSRPPAAGAAKPAVVKAPARPRAKAGPAPVDRAGDLRTMRDALLAAMGQVDPKDLPRVCSELRAVDAELATLAPTRSEGQVLVDELKARRARRTAP